MFSARPDALTIRHGIVLLSSLNCYPFPKVSITFRAGVIFALVIRAGDALVVPAAAFGVSFLNAVLAAIRRREVVFAAGETAFHGVGILLGTDGIQT